jgi:hypothetical protein
MADHIHFQTTNVAGCGTQNTLPNIRPAITSPPTSFTCNIPVGNYFQLTGTATDSSFYQWDQIDTGLENFANTALPRFRSWKPRTTTTRFFPNLYYLTRGLQVLPIFAHATHLYSHVEVPSSDLFCKSRFLIEVTRILRDCTGFVTVLSRQTSVKSLTGPILAR